MIKFFVFCLLFLTIAVFLCMYRAVKGPTAADRLIPINAVGTKTIVMILIISFVINETYFIDVAVVYALISFVATVVIAKYLRSLGG